MKLFYRELGDGPPLIIQHGLFGSSDNWLTVSKAFAESFKVYLLDARNHGRSESSEVFTYKAMSEDLWEFIQEHRIENPVIIGHSMGGKMLMRFMADHPEFKARYIVVDISPRYYKRHHDEILNGLNSLNIDMLESRQQADDELAVYVPSLPERQFLLKNLYKNEEGKFAWRVNLKVITRDIENIGEALDENISIYAPVMFMRGETSHYIREADIELIKKIFKNSEVVTVNGAGHWVQADQPVAFVNFVKDFLERTNK